MGNRDKTLALIVGTVIFAIILAVPMPTSADTHHGFNLNNDGVYTTIVYQPDPVEGKDASVHQQEGGQWGSAWFCGAWMSDGGVNARGLVEFDVSDLPYPVISAKLQMHGEPRGQISGLPNIGDVSVYQVTSPWEEMVVMWNTMPSFDENPIDTEPPDITRWYEWDITNLYNSWKSGASDNYGVILINRMEGTRTTGIILKSSDYEDPSLRPKLILTYALPVIEASIDLDPDTLNFKSNGQRITVYIELPNGYDVADVNVGTVLLDGIIPAEAHPTEVGDYDNDAITDLMVKFDRQALIEYLGGTTGQVTLTVSGILHDGTPFEGSDTITVINPGE